MNRAKISITDPDYDHSLFTVTRNEDPKTFSEFVDQVISNAPVNLQKKKVSTICKRDCDPLSVLHNHGLLNIDKTPKTKNCPRSEIDVTFYTEETHLGELVKLFSSTHKFRNGKLVYATTQEVAPEVAEEVDMFNKRWQLECSPERMKDKEEKRQSYTTSRKKSLMNMLSDLDKEQTLKRYGKTSKRDQKLHHEELLAKPGCYCEKKETTYDNDLRKQRIERYFEKSREAKSNNQEREPLTIPGCYCEKKEASFDSDLRNQRIRKYIEESREIKSDCYLKEDVSSIKDHHHREVRYVPELKPVGKKIYHAAWRQRPPQKSPSKTVRFTMEQSLTHTSPTVSRAPQEKSMKTDQIQVISKTYSRSTIKGLCKQDESSDSADYPRIYQQHAEGCENEWPERLKGQKCRSPYNVRDKTRNQQSEFHHSRSETSAAGDRYTQTRESHLETHKLHPDRTRRESPPHRAFSHCCAEGDIFLGDNEAISSDSNTSICTIYYDCESEYVKRTSPVAERKKDDFVNHKHCYHEKRKSGGRKITELQEASHNFGLFSKVNKSHNKKSPRRDLSNADYDNEVLRHCCHEKKYKDERSRPKSPPGYKQYPTKVDMECFAECRQRNKEHHQVSVTRETVKNVNSLMSQIPEDEFQSLYIRENMVNNEALKEFQRRYGKCLCFKDDLKPLPSYPREHFMKNIEKSHRHKHL